MQGDPRLEEEGTGLEDRLQEEEGIHREDLRLEEEGDIRLEEPRQEGADILQEQEEGILQDREDGVGEEAAVEEEVEEGGEEVLGGVEETAGLKLQKHGPVEGATGRIPGREEPHQDLMIQEVTPLELQNTTTSHGLLGMKMEPTLPKEPPKDSSAMLRHSTTNNPPRRKG